MDVFIVRTRLQALIAKRIVFRNSLRRFILVCAYQNSRSEDAAEVYELYGDLRQAATFSLDVIEANGFFKSFFKFLFLGIISALSGGKVYLAGVDSYPFALSAKVIPFLKISTFDDGSANFLKASKYFDESPIKGAGVKKKALRLVFPFGCAKYLRSRSTRHYTIFGGLPNIVEGRLVTELDWDWDNLFDMRDDSYVTGNIKVVVVGTPIHDYTDQYSIRKKADFALKTCDIYISHPREREWAGSEKVVRLRSPAEAFLCRLKGEGKVKVYHFNSTVAYALKSSENLEFVDLMSDEF